MALTSLRRSFLKFIGAIGIIVISSALTPSVIVVGMIVIIPTCVAPILSFFVKNLLFVCIGRPWEFTKRETLLATTCAWLFILGNRRGGVVRRVNVLNGAQFDISRLRYFNQSWNVIHHATSEATNSV